MDFPKMNSQNFETLTQEIINSQSRKLLENGRIIVPNLTPEDMLQPNDYEELENNPNFRYEEGFLHGMLSLQMALRVMLKSEEIF